jgi:hypothetical protein
MKMSSRMISDHMPYYIADTLAQAAKNAHYIDETANATVITTDVSQNSDLNGSPFD